MIAACYSMDLYCENNHSGPTQFTGNAWTDTARKARRAGWIITSDKQKAFCPYCVNIGKVPAQYAKRKRRK